MLRPVRAVAFAAALGFALVAAPARAERGWTADDSTRLSRGETVTREQTIERGDRHYVGGVTYTVLDASAAEIGALLEDVTAYRRLLPKTKSARLVATDRDDRLIELASGNSLVTAEYTLRVRRAAAGREWRFWLEPSRPHGIDDAWGFFRLTPFVTSSGEQKVLLTYGVLVDVGPGIVRDLFEERVRSALLSVPQLVRGCVAEARRAAL